MSARLIPVALLTLLVASVGVVTAAEPATPGSSAAGLPPFADVLEYRADAARTGRVAGPGPFSQPVQVWSRAIDGSLLARPVLVDGLLLVGGTDHRLYALDARTGEERWRFQAGGAIDGLLSSDGSVVVFGSDDGVLHALDVSDGHERWRRPLLVYTTVILNGRVYVPAGDGTVYGLDLGTGEVDWSWVAPAPLVSDNTSALAADGDTLYVGVTDGRLYALSIPEASERWHLQTVGRFANSVSLSDDQAFVATPVFDEPVGVLYALDRGAGTVDWTLRTPGGHNVVIGALGDGVAYIGTVDDGVVALPLTDSSGGVTPTPLWQASLDGARNFRGQLLTADSLYVPTFDAPGAVIAFDPVTGERRWDISVGAALNGMVVSGGMLFMADDAGTVSAWAEPGLAAAIGPVATGPLGAFDRPRPADPVTITRTLGAADIGVAIPLSMDFGPDGLLYVLDSAPSIRVIDPAADRVVRSWGQQGTADGELDVRDPSGANVGFGGIDVGDDGLVYVADGGNHRIQVFRPDGTYLRQYGSYGTEEGRFIGPVGILRDASGDIYVLDNSTSVTKLGVDGGFLWRIGGADAAAEGLPADLNDLALLPDGNLAIVSDAGRVITVDPATGAAVDTWDASGNQPGELGAGCRLSIDDAGDLWIYSCEPRETQVFGPDRTLLGGSYAGRDTVLRPVFGPGGVAYALGDDASTATEIYRIRVDLPAGSSPAPGSARP